MIAAVRRFRPKLDVGASHIPRWNRASLQARGLVAWWPLSPCAGNMLPEVYGARHGAVADLTWTADAEFGAVPSFDGNREASYFDGQLPSGGAPRTLSAWVKYTEIPIEGRTRGILFYGTRSFDHGVCIGTGYTSRWQPPGCLGMSQWGKELVTPRAYNDGAWHLLAATFDGVVWAVYVDGGLENVNALPTDTWPAQGCIGGFDFGPQYRWKGSVRDLRIYDRALSAAEVRTLFDPATRFDLFVPRRQPWARAAFADPVYQVRAGEVYVAGPTAAQVYVSGAETGELASTQ